MEKMQMKRIISRIEAETNATCKVEIGKCGVPIIICYHNYEGLYPQFGTFYTIDRIESIVKRFRGVQCEVRGHYTATYIW